MAWLGNLVAAGAALALGVASIDLLAPTPTETVYASVPEMRDTCEVLFVGPSYVNSQIFPEVVDASAKEAGRTLRSCKFARMHLKGFELKREISRLLEAPWAKLRLVVFDVTLGVDTGFKPDNRYKPRVLRWHTWDLLPWYLDHLDGQRTRGKSPYWRLGEHVRHVMVNTLLVGRGPEILAEVSRERKIGRATAPSSPEGVEEIDKAELERLRRLNERRLPRLLRQRRRGQSLTPPATLAAWIQELRAVTQQHGIEGDALIAPIWKSNFVKFSASSSGRPPVVHAFDDPRKFPTLYEVGMHDRSEHLTPAGSREYSRLLGQVLAKRLEELE